MLADSFSQISDPRLEECIGKWNNFLNSIQPSEKVGVIFHGDMDGLVGATYISQVLQKRFQSLSVSLFWISTDEYDFLSLKKWISETKLDKLAIVDISIENHVSTLEFIRSKVRSTVFIYDHHILQNKSYPENFIVANPTPQKLLKGELPVPSFSFSYKLAQNNNLSFPDWLLILSIFSEGVDNYYVEDLRVLYSKLGFNLADGANQYRKSDISRIAKLVNAEFSSDEKSCFSLEVFSRVAQGEIQNFKNAYLQLKEKIGFIADDRSNEITKCIDEWKKKLEVSPLKEDIVIFIPVTSRYSIAGPVASILRGQFPDKVFISYTIKDSTAIIEMRTRNDTHLNFVTILTRISEKIEFINFGGHPPAAGASLHKNRLGDFLKIVKEEVMQDYSRSSNR